MSGNTRLSKNQIELISQLASQEAIRQYKAQEKNRKKQEKDWRLRNTKLLLENYHRLRDHCEDIENQVEEYEDTVFALEELTLESLMKYQLKTAKMMRHFDRMLKHFASDCNAGTEEDRRRLKVIQLRYLNRKRLNITELCEMLSVEQTTIYRDTRQAINSMSIYLFGVSALDMLEF
jgi:Mg2+ and Co2+ transporter CorA